MTGWLPFAILIVVICSLILSLTYLTKRAFVSSGPESIRSVNSDVSEPPREDLEDPDVSLEGATTPTNALADERTETIDDTAASSRQSPTLDIEDISTGALFANVLASHGLFAIIILVGILYFSIPFGALGVEMAVTPVIDAIALGLPIGIGLYLLNELGAIGFRRIGFDYDESLRRALGPDSVGGWLLLLGVVLPVIAVFEELLFRAVIIGAFSVGFSVSPWVLVVISSVLFALGHSLQGISGMLVTGILGFVLGVVFIVTGNLFVVIVAHYVVNSLEFVVHEAFGIDWVRPDQESQASNPPRR